MMLEVANNRSIVGGVMLQEWLEVIARAHLWAN
jgi:hypothetical protein